MFNIKKAAGVILAISLLSSSFTANADMIYENISDTIVTGGVTHRKIDQFTEGGWTKANVLVIDLNNPNVKIKTLTAPDGSSHRTTVKKMAENDGALAAVNSDFFNMVSGQTNMLGMVYKDGELVSTPSTDQGLANIAFLENNSVVMDYFSSYSEAISPQGYYCQIAQVNKMPITSGAINKYTSEWSQYSFGTLDGMQEIVVENDIVVDIRTYQDPVEIPQNGYVLYTNPAVNGFFTDNFKVGDSIVTNTIITPDVGKINEASGGGSIIVKDSKIYPFTNEIKGYSQRTAVGINNTTNTLFLVTTDGRMSDCKGMTQTQLAEFMIALGCDTALNLDGGGSTTMVTRNRYTQALDVVNTLSSSMRSVSVGLGVFSQSEAGAPYGIEAMLNQSTVMLGDTIEVYCNVYDENYNNTYVPLEDISFSIDDENAVVDVNKIRPVTAGKHTVTVSTGDISTTIPLTVIGELTNAYTYPNKIDLTVGAASQIAITGTDADGNASTVSPEHFQWTSSNPNITVDKGLVTANADGEALISARIGDIVTYATVSTTGVHPQKPLDTAVSDKFMGDIDGKRINFIGDLSTGNTMLKRLLAYKKSVSINLSGAKTFFTKGMGSAFGAITAPSHEIEGYSVSNIDATAVITLDNSDGSFRASQKNQWTNLKAELESSLAKNIIIAITNPLNTVNANEQSVFKDFLDKQVKNGKNVFVVSSGDETVCRTENGIRYITCGNINNAHSSTLVGYNIPASRYVYFTISGEDIRFNFCD